MREIWPKDPYLKFIIRKQCIEEAVRYRWSQFALPFKMSDRTLLYNTLTGQCLETDTIDLQNTSFSSRQIEERQELLFLMQENYLVPEEKDECALYKSIYKMRRSGQKQEGFSGVMILPTFSCNARCVYCFEEGIPQASMSAEMVEKTISFLLSGRDKKADLSLRWFGGEPLLGESIIDRICSALKENGVKYHSGITTNGSLITRRIAEKMSTLWQVKNVKISMDCAEEEYIRRKKYPHYKNTYWQVMQNINLLQEYKIQVDIRCNVDEQNMDQIPQFLSDLEKTIKNKKDLLVSFSPLHASAEKETSLPLIKRIAEADKLIREKGFTPPPLKNISGFRVNHCMADNFGRNIVITPDGQLYLCDFCEPGTSVGTVEEGITRPEIAESYQETGEIREKCRNCPFLPLCTPFSKCPIKTYHCKEIQRRMTQEALKARLKAQETSPNQ